MKNFVISLIVFLLIGILATTNAVILNDKATELITALEALPENPDGQKAKEIIDLWYSHESCFNLTVSHTVTDRIEENLYCLKNAGDSHSFLASRDVLLVLLRDMKDSSSISLDRIL
ncbi:MAG: DUF4363 family protein [Clostridia bacterium]|nr:DUF4363 family protein [Clostridia bacterium]